jgi:hypothetical protein
MRPLGFIGDAKQLGREVAAIATGGSCANRQSGTFSLLVAALDLGGEIGAGIQQTGDVGLIDLRGIGESLEAFAAGERGRP